MKALACVLVLTVSTVVDAGNFVLPEPSVTQISGAVLAPTIATWTKITYASCPIMTASQWAQAQAAQYFDNNGDEAYTEIVSNCSAYGCYNRNVAVLVTP